jgi:hypothetical protein
MGLWLTQAPGGVYEPAGAYSTETGMKKRYKSVCRKPGCRVSFVNEFYRDIHEQKPHHECPLCKRQVVCLKHHQRWAQKTGYRNCLPPNEIMGGG